jgi:photosystem II stability/assembly factor-like uncharacterized protein
MLIFHSPRRDRARRGADRKCRPTLIALEGRALLSGVPSQWSIRGSGGGGSLFAPQINPYNPAEYYVSSDMSQLFHTTNSGASWQTVDFRQIQGGHETRVQYTENPNILYALDYSSINGVDNQRPDVSTDGGQTWHPLANDPTFSGAFYFVVDPANHNRMAIADYQNIYFSADAGQTWSQKYTAKDSNAGIVVGGAFWDGANIYLGTNDGLLASTNGGQSFSLMNIGGIASGQVIRSFAGAKQGSTVRFLAVTDNSGDVYGGIQGYDNNGGQQVYTLDLGAANWTPRTVPSSAWPVFAGMALADANTLYVAGGGTIGNPTVYKSTNGGGSWQSVLSTTGNVNVQTGWSGSGGDRDWSYGELAMGFVVDSTDANRIMITDFGFAHSSTDGGTNWKALYVNPADLNPAGTSIPKGKAYHDSGLDNTTSWQVAWADPTHLFVGNSDVRGQLSADGGQTFGFGYTGQPYNSMFRVAVASNGTLYGAAGSTHDLYQSTTLTDSRIDGATGAVLWSTDKGVTWQTLHNFAHEVSWVATDPTNPNRLYASVVSSTAGGIYVTNNLSSGASSTWTKLTNPPRTEGHPLDIMVLNDGTLVASFSGRRNSAGAFTASSGVFISSDGGQTWLDRSAAGMKYWTWDVTVDPHDATQSTWYTGVFSGWGGAPNNLGGLYKTTDRGQTWSRVLTLSGVTSATFNPADPNELFVASETDGLWYSNNIQSAAPTFSQVASYPFRQPERVSFSPYNSNEIWVTSFGSGVMVGTTPSAQPGAFQLSSTTYSANENGGTATITVNRVGGSTGAVTVQYATSDGTATGGSDFTSTSGTLSWAAGDVAPKTFTIPIIDDSLVEGNETVNVTLTNPTGGATLGAPASGVLTIVDNDTPPVGSLQFTATTASVNEGAGTAVVTVSRTGGSSGAVTVSYATANGSAVAPGDFTIATGTLSWASGDTSPKTITVPIIDDAIVESSETFSITLSAPTGGATLGAVSTAVVTIVDNDVAPVGVLQFTAATATVNEGAGSVVVTVSRTGGSSGAVTVSYATANGSAVAPGDYTIATGTLSWANGDAAPKTISVPIIDDTIVESSETFSITLSTPTGGATLGSNSTAVVTIVDNDAPPPPPGGLPYAVGSDSGMVGTVKMYNSDGSLRFAATPFGSSYSNGVRVAAGDVTGDGVADVVVANNGAGTTKGVVRVIDGKSGRLLPNTLSAGQWFYGAPSIAVGDVNGDGVADVAVGSDDGGPMVRVYRGGDFASLATFAAGPTSNYWGHTEVALADMNHDGLADLAVSGLYTTGVRVSGFNGGSLRPGSTPTAVFTAFTLTGRGFEGAPGLAAGDVNGDGYADLMFGSGAWSTTRVLVLSGKSLVQTGARLTLADFAPAGTEFGFGVRVALRDLDGDGKADLVIGAGSGRGSRVNVYYAKTLITTGAPPLGYYFDAYPGFNGGVFVG